MHLGLMHVYCAFHMLKRLHGIGVARSGVNFAVTPQFICLVGVVVIDGSGLWLGRKCIRASVTETVPPFAFVAFVSNLTRHPHVKAQALLLDNHARTAAYRQAGGRR